MTDQTDPTTEQDPPTETNETAPAPTAPTKRFSDFGLDASLTDALEAQGIVHPFPIQELTLPMALKGADIIGQARTGTGKTFGFGLPLLQRIDPTVARTQALVVVPTRELCLQVTDDLAVGAARGLTIQSVYGGVGFDEQIEALTSGVHVVVGTPGRLLDHLGRGNLDLSGVTELVLDEADEMLDMGFLPDVERLIEACTGEKRHTMLFSATMPTAVVKLARRYMTQPTFMRAEAEERETAPTVDQHFLLVHRMDKPRVLARILQSPGRGNVYVFTRTKHMADRLVDELETLGTKAIAIHGDLRQGTREKNMDAFRDGKVDVLVATEVAARGLDVDNVTHVVNYDCPDDEKMYLHRIGRTARAGAKGVAVTFAEFNEVDRLNVIRKAVKAETELLEVFSTSDELTARFDLPAETPWAHLSRKGGGGSRGGSSNRSSGRSSDRSEGRGSGRSSSDRDRDRKRPETDGRPKSSRRSAGGGSDATADRERPRRDRAEATERTDATERSQGGATAEDPPRLGERDEKAEVVRTRTRSRTRDTDGGDDSAKDEARSTDRRARDDVGSDRPRARARDRGDRTPDDQPTRSRQRDTRDDDGSREDAKDDAGRARRSRSRSGGGGSADGRSGRDDAGRSERSSGDRKRSSDRSSDRGGSRGGSDRNGSRKGGSRSEPVRSARDVIPGMVPTQQGDDARGEGQPQLNRRVRVEHLP